MSTPRSTQQHCRNAVSLGSKRSRTPGWRCMAPVRSARHTELDPHPGAREALEPLRAGPLREPSSRRRERPPAVGAAAPKPLGRLRSSARWTSPSVREPGAGSSSLMARGTLRNEQGELCIKRGSRGRMAAPSENICNGRVMVLRCSRARVVLKNACSWPTANRIAGESPPAARSGATGKGHRQLQPTLGLCRKQP